MGLRIPLVIDRVRITGLALNKEQYQLGLEQLPELVYFFKKCYKNSPNSVHYYQGDHTRQIQYRDNRMQSIARIEIGTTKMSHRYLAWTIWPHRTKNSSFFDLCEFVMKLMSDPIYDYEFAYKNGRVNEIELASDFLTTKMHSFIPWIKKARLSSIYDPYGVKGQIKIGGDLSPRAFSIYDKARQMKEMALPNQYPTRTRIEAISRKTKLAPKNLILLKNPFDGLEVADLYKAENICNDEQWKLFLKLQSVYGSAAAFSSTPKPLRMKFREMLLSCHASWWNVKNIWSGYPDAIKALEPSVIFS